MPAAAQSAAPKSARRFIRYRLYPGNAGTGSARCGTACAAPCTWNLFVVLYGLRRRTWQANPLGSKPSGSFLTPGQLFTQMRKGKPNAWLAAALRQVRPGINDYT